MKLELRATRLANGLRVATATMPTLESVALGIWVGAGGRHERAEQAGISHFIEHLLFKGTTTRSARAISQAIEGRGGYLNAYTQEESTCYYAHIAAEHTAEALDLLTDMFLQPRFAAGDIKKERGVIIEEIEMYRDQPQQHVQEMLNGILWPNHPLGRSLTGTPETVSTLKRDDFFSYKATRYAPAVTLVAFAGQVEHESTVAQVGKILGSWNARRPSTPRPVTVRSPQHAVTVLGKDIEQAQLALGLRLFGRHDPRKYALKLLSTVLGENMSSRLFQVVRERHGLAYSIHTSVELFHDTGMLEISAGVDAEKLPRAVQLIIGELKRLCAQPIGAAELRRAKDYVIGQLRIGLEGATHQMTWAADNLLNFDCFIQPDEIITAIHRISAADIRQLARAVLRAERLSLALIAPAAGTAEEKLLRAARCRLA
ncbi:MAG: insulinase family protein [Verrucomicrobia bacterium]|nr:MAG: insulinase family protein [Verrucomicrobiota bacterium]